MEVRYYSVEASVFEKGKPIKGTLSLFIDEYSFGSIRETVDWENVSYEKSTATIKGFLRSSKKPCISFKYNEKISPQFIIEDEQMDIVINGINTFAEIQKVNRERKEAEKRAITEENRIREEARRKEDEEFRLKQEVKRRQKAEVEQLTRAAKERRLAEKQTRIKKIIEEIKEQPNTEFVDVTAIAKKAGGCILDNPYRTLAISCLATNEEANTALDKLKKLDRLNALAAYKSPYDLIGLEKPTRNLSVAQNSISLLKDKNNKWFWFAEPEPCMAWKSGKYRIELSRDGQEYGTYDLFLANYMYAILCDPNFKVSETWKRVLNYYCFICNQDGVELLRSRFSQKEVQNLKNEELLLSFRKTIFKPIILLCERDDLGAILRLHNYIKDCGNRLLNGIDREVVGKLVSWFTDKEVALMKYLSEIDGEEIPDSKRLEIRKRGEEYCQVVEPMLEMVLRDFRGDAVRYEMIKESYRTVTYQCMYVLNKCSDKSDAIFFANKCYSYCKSDDKKRIKNTFGEVNIKAIDWNIPHTIWDIKGDEYYYGRGCNVDYAQAVYWYHKAADAGNMHSMNSIGVCYQKGTGVPQNDEQAIVWFEKATDAGNPEGAYNLAECFFNGAGVKKNIENALKYWAVAAKLGHPSAQKKRDDVFSKIKMERRKHRSKNHVCHDLGFQMTTGPSIAVEVTLNKAANAFLVNVQGYQNYLSGDEFSYHGGYTTQSPYKIRIPSSNHWYVIVDNGDGPINDIVSSAKIKRI